MTWFKVCDGVERWVAEENLYYEIRVDDIRRRLVRYQTIRTDDGCVHVRINELGKGTVNDLKEAAHRDYLLHFKKKEN